jgi:hypothetical protein
MQVAASQPRRTLGDPAEARGYDAPYSASLHLLQPEQQQHRVQLCYNDIGITSQNSQVPTSSIEGPDAFTREPGTNELPSENTLRAVLSSHLLSHAK